jgi:hypothetical protein
MYCQATSFLHPVFFSAKVVYFFYFDYFFAVFLPFFLCFTLLHIPSDAQIKGKTKNWKKQLGKSREGSSTKDRSVASLT